MFIVMINDYNEPIYCTNREHAAHYVEHVVIPRMKINLRPNAVFERREDRWSVRDAMCFIRIEAVKEYVPGPDEPAVLIWEIWLPGHGCAPDDHGPPSLVGKMDGATFQDACNRYADAEWYFFKLYDAKKLTWDGARLYPSASEAGQDVNPGRFYKPQEEYDASTN